jgi:hypothetical protein
MRTRARTLLPDQWKAALEDVNAFLAAHPDEPNFVAMRGFLLAGLDQPGVVEDARKIAAGSGQVYQMVFLRAQQAAQLKVPGNWLNFYVALSEVAPQKEVRVYCYKVIAMAHQSRDDKKSAVSWLKKVLEITPNDEPVKRAVEQMEAAEKK